ncbi:(p)ppGpp synthetase [Geomonas paludis]|uniref:(P)ppGpp synthetase n=1 Tax=Geomonas paludis TaxID=2740185 RepID=A0A6V8MXQ8_9BACT|nr:(p)ppGpp synthetase [Geomonas paludis]UPU37430.1 (p)ppGpp synthetase [Geomonas paludis]GFO63999.1 (p)ppGpp synthetase [Geomonas paludis]
MASLDFEQEKAIFNKYYESNHKQLIAAKDAYLGMIRTLVRQSDVGEVTKIEGRVKEREECIKKFQRKYQGKLEADEQPYAIKDFISDLVGIRVVCLYEDEVPVVSALLQRHYTILNVTDKTSAVESTEDSFGYKGLHMDLALDPQAPCLAKHLPPMEISFEVQIRSLIQDAWSRLDHKIKYKKSIPVDLKRRINVLAALFELADREFKEIRNATSDLMQQATVTQIEPEAPGQAASAGTRTVNAFNFVPIAAHFFRDFVFDDEKVDDFVQDILEQNSTLLKAELHRCLNENLKVVREYRDHIVAENPERTFSAYTSIRHCLYLYDPEKFPRILSRRNRERFVAWMKANQPAPETLQP